MSDADGKFQIEIFLQNKHKFYPKIPYFILFFMLGCHSWCIMCTTFTTWIPNEFYCVNAR